MIIGVTFTKPYAPGRACSPSLLLRLSRAPGNLHCPESCTAAAAARPQVVPLRVSRAAIRPLRLAKPLKSCRSPSHGAAARRGGPLAKNGCSHGRHDGSRGRDGWRLTRNSPGRQEATGDSMINREATPAASDGPTRSQIPHRHPKRLGRRGLEPAAIPTAASSEPQAGRASHGRSIMPAVQVSPWGMLPFLCPHGSTHHKV